MKKILIIVLSIASHIAASQSNKNTKNTQFSKLQKEVVGHISIAKIKKRYHCSEYTMVYALQFRPFYLIKRRVEEDGTFATRYRTKQGEILPDDQQKQLINGLTKAFDQYKPFASKISKNNHVYWKYYADGQVELDERSIQIKKPKIKSKL